MNVPCKDCKERHFKCHADCEQYKQFVVLKEELKESKKDRAHIEMGGYYRRQKMIIMHEINRHKRG